jgi:hypothetical protein
MVLMAGTIKLFEKDERGLLREVAPEEADRLRQGRSFSHVSLVIDVLWTAEEEAEREAEVAAREAEEERRRVERDKADRLRGKRRAEIAGRLGLSSEDLAELLRS